MKRRMAVFLVLGAELLGACGAEVAPDDKPGASNVEVSGRKEALWINDCDDQQQSYIDGAIIGAYYSLQSALQTYETGSNRANYYFGVGYDDQQVQYRLGNMWTVMNDQNLTVVCAHSSGNCDPNVSGQYNWAYVNTDDVDNHVSTIQVCDRFFDPSWTPGEQDYLASPAGILLHEMAHLAGAPYWADYIGIENVRQWAQQAPSQTYNIADAFRYYIFNIYNQ